MHETEVDTLIIGAGLSGLMMGYRLKKNYQIIERGTVNVSAKGPFYLHSPITWLPSTWKEIDVHHNCWDPKRGFKRIPDIGMMNDYAKKITGKIIDTSLKFMDGKVKRGYLPSEGNVVGDLCSEVEEFLVVDTEVIELNAQEHYVIVQDRQKEFPPQRTRYNRLINTMPLPILLKMIGMETKYEFVAEPIYSWQYLIEPGLVVDSYQIINITTPTYKAYRASLMHNYIFVESMTTMDAAENDNLIESLWDLDGGYELMMSRKIHPGKFHPIEKTARRMLLAKLTQDHDIYCLGRYAVWDYKRIDHIAEDVEEILKLIELRSN